MKNVWILIFMMGWVTSGYGQDIGDGGPYGPKFPVKVKTNRYKDGTLSSSFSINHGQILIDNTLTVSKEESELYSLFYGNLDLAGELMVYTDPSRSNLLGFVESLNTPSWVGIWNPDNVICGDCESSYYSKDITISFNVTQDGVLAGKSCDELESFFYTVRVFPVVHSNFGFTNSVNILSFSSCDRLGVWPSMCYESLALPSVDFTIECDDSDGNLRADHGTSETSINDYIHFTENKKSFYYTTLTGVIVRGINRPGIYLRVYNNGEIEKVFVSSE